MHPAIGLLGILIFAIGGLLLFTMLYSLAEWIRTNVNPGQDFIIGSFFGFLIIGFGLWLVVQSGRPETK